MGPYLKAWGSSLVLETVPQSLVTFSRANGIKFHKSLFWVPILAAGGPYWVHISKKKNGSLLGPYLKAWGSFLVFETMTLEAPLANWFKL